MLKACTRSKPAVLSHGSQLFAAVYQALAAIYQALAADFRLLQPNFRLLTPILRLQASTAKETNLSLGIP